MSPQFFELAPFNSNLYLQFYRLIARFSGYLADVMAKKYA